MTEEAPPASPPREAPNRLLFAPSLEYYYTADGKDKHGQYNATRASAMLVERALSSPDPLWASSLADASSAAAPIAASTIDSALSSMPNLDHDAAGALRQAAAAIYSELPCSPSDKALNERAASSSRNVASTKKVSTSRGERSAIKTGVAATTRAGRAGGGEGKTRHALHASPPKAPTLSGPGNGLQARKLEFDRRAEKEPKKRQLAKEAHMTKDVATPPPAPAKPSPGPKASPPSPAKKGRPHHPAKRPPKGGKGGKKAPPKAAAAPKSSGVHGASSSGFVPMPEEDEDDGEDAPARSRSVTPVRSSSVTASRQVATRMAAADGAASRVTRAGNVLRSASPSATSAAPDQLPSAVVEDVAHAGHGHVHSNVEPSPAVAAAAASDAHSRARAHPAPASAASTSAAASASDAGGSVGISVFEAGPSASRAVSPITSQAVYSAPSSAADAADALDADASFTSAATAETAAAEAAALEAASVEAAAAEAEAVWGAPATAPILDDVDVTDGTWIATTARGVNGTGVQQFSPPLRSLLRNAAGRSHRSDAGGSEGRSSRKSSRVSFSQPLSSPLTSQHPLSRVLSEHSAQTGVHTPEVRAASGGGPPPAGGVDGAASGWGESSSPNSRSHRSNASSGHTFSSGVSSNHRLVQRAILTLRNANADARGGAIDAMLLTASMGGAAPTEPVVGRRGPQQGPQVPRLGIRGPPVVGLGARGGRR